MGKQSLFSRIGNSLFPVLLVFFIALFSLWSLMEVNGKKTDKKYKILRDMTVEVKHPDGTEDRYDSKLFTYHSKKDKITVHLPLKAEWKKENQSINFFFYGGVVKAYYKDKLISTAGEHLKRHMIGHLRVFIPVPEEAFGDEIRVEIQPGMDFMEDTFHAPVLMPVQDALYFPILHNESSFAFFYMLFIGSYIGIIILGYFYFTEEYAKEGFWLMLLINGIIAWYMGNSGMIYAVNANEDFNAIVEYIGMYMLFFSAPLYSSYETTRPGVKRYLRTAGTLLCLVFFTCLILYLLPTGYTFVYHLRIAQGVQIVMVFSSLLSLLFPGKRNKRTADYIMQYGLIFVAFFGILEQVRIIFATHITENYPGFLRWFAAAPFSKWLLFILVLTFLSSYAFKVSYIVENTLAEKQLKSLAYSDNLTKMGNRQYLQKELDELDKEKNPDYAVIFMDVNDLKYTNDHFGHEAGDQLLRMVSSAIKEAMKNKNGFSGRNGGDEFLAVLRSSVEATGVCARILEVLERIRIEKEVQFPVSIAVGIAAYHEVTEEIRSEGKGEAAVTSDVIRTADKRMYEEKLATKKSLYRAEA